MQADTVNEKIKSFILKKFPLARRRNISNNDQLLESGILDSLGILTLVKYIEEQFKISVSDEDLVPENFQNIERLTTFIQSKGNSRSS